MTTESTTVIDHIKNIIFVTLSRERTSETMHRHRRIDNTITIKKNLPLFMLTVDVFGGISFFDDDMVAFDYGALL